MSKSVIYNSINKPQCNVCKEKTNITLDNCINEMNNDFSTKNTIATFFCEKHKGTFNIIGNNKENYKYE